MRSPKAGQYRAETTITVTKATMNNSPPFNPNTAVAYGSFQSPATPTRLLELSAVSGSNRDCVLGLGSNLGNRLAYLRGAVRQLQLHAQITAISALYETDAVGPAQPDYLNAAIRLRTALEPLALLEVQLGIERASGRVRLERWGPRTLDLDLLFIFGEAVAEPGLVVPHAELTRRAFALLPLLDVMPDAQDPLTGVRYSEFATGLDRTGVRELPNSRAGWLE